MKEYELTEEEKKIIRKILEKDAYEVMGRVINNELSKIRVNDHQHSHMVEVLQGKTIFITRGGEKGLEDSIQGQFSYLLKRLIGPPSGGWL